jgi:hypothetical protein
MFAVKYLRPTQFHSSVRPSPTYRVCLLTTLRRSWIDNVYMGCTNSRSDSHDVRLMTSHFRRLPVWSFRASRPQRLPSFPPLTLSSPKLWRLRAHTCFAFLHGSRYAVLSFSNGPPWMISFRAGHVKKRFYRHSLISKAL